MKCESCLEPNIYAKRDGKSLCERCYRKCFVYKISFDKLVALMKISNCQICDKEITFAYSGRHGGTTNSAHIDHDHDTGIVRGVLCPNCNFLEGFLKRQSNPDEWIKRVKAWQIEGTMSHLNIQLPNHVKTKYGKDITWGEE